MLGVDDKIVVVGEASDGYEGIKKALELKPDVVLMDLVMPGLDGLETTRRIRKKIPKAKVLFLTQYDSKEYVQSAIKAGGHGYIPKKAVGSELLKAIYTVVQGDYYLFPSTVGALVEGYIKSSDTDPHGRLTSREREILKLIADGHTSRKISEILRISFKTVQGHRAKIMDKLGIHNRTDLIRYAMRKGLVSIDS